MTSSQKRPHNTNTPTAHPAVINPSLSTHVAPNAHEVQRFLDRKRYQELGYELPMTTREAAAYVGMHWKTVEKKAREGTIPAHPVSGVHRKTWKFYASELDAWLRGQVSSPRHPCSPNGKDKIQ